MFKIYSIIAFILTLTFAASNTNDSQFINIIPFEANATEANETNNNITIDAHFFEKVQLSLYYNYYLKCRQNNDPKDCYMAGEIASSIKKYNEALDMYKISCEKNYSSGCTNLGYLLSDAIAYGGNHNNNFEAVKYYKKACSLKNYDGCESLAIEYYNGNFVPQNRAKALHLFQQACNKGNSMYSCNTTGVMFENGYGCKRSLNQALEYYRKGCVGKNLIACKNYATLKQTIDKK